MTSPPEAAKSAEIRMTSMPEAPKPAEIRMTSPPEAANVISLGLSAATLIVASALTLQIPWTAALNRYRVGFVALVLLCTLGNRSFLAWTSSGLETALVNLLVLSWLYWILSRRPSPAWALLTATTSSLLALTRPDGLLFVTTSLAAIALARTGSTHTLHLPWTALPLLVVPAHLLWRKHFYGNWLPNTYYAKTPAAWPESGVRYAASFILEYALWFWFALGAYVLLSRVARGRTLAPKNAPPFRH